LIDTILQGDCREVLKQFPDNYIDLTVTSPPYDNLRKYHGYTFDFESIAKELFRVTKPGGVVVWVVGDATIKGSETGTSFKQALYFKEIGFNLHDTMIYNKINYVPLNHGRYEQEFEYMFVLSNGKPKAFNPLKTACKSAGCATSGRTFYQSNSQNEPSPSHKNDVVHDEKARGNVWRMSTNSGTSGHPAQFPEQLASDHILSWSNPGDLILDPMCGSGTTCKMAKKNNRHFIGIEISEEYCEIARHRIASVPRKLTAYDRIPA